MNPKYVSTRVFVNLKNCPPGFVYLKGYLLWRSPFQLIVVAIWAPCFFHFGLLADHANTLGAPQMTMGETGRARHSVDVCSVLVTCLEFPLGKGVDFCNFCRICSQVFFCAVVESTFGRAIYSNKAFVRSSNKKQRST